jgi:hypothetical protein
MLGVEGDHDRLPGDQQGLEARRLAVVATQADQRRIQPAGGQGRQQGVGLILDQP